MNKEEIDNLEDYLKNNLPKIESTIPITTFGNVGLEDLMDSIKQFKKVPTHDELLRENKRLRNQLEEKDKVINEAIERCDYYLSFEASDKLFENAISEVKDSLLNQYSSNEVWKDIKGYEGIYQVSNLGRVRSLDREITYPNGKIGLYKGKIIKLKMSKYGYIVFHFSVDNKKKALSVHRLVAQAFIPNPENKKCVNHLDCNRTNNKVSNLEWCTHQENVQYSIKCGTFKGFHKKERGKNGKIQ